MRFARLPDRALATVRQVVEEDAEFRGRVALAANEAGLDRAPWLWLVRPQGWAEELESFTQAADAAALEVQAERAERNALRRLAVAESTSARTEAELARLQDANVELLAEITSERQSRRRSEVERDDLEAARRSADAKLASLTEIVDQLQARISALTADADEGVRRLSSMRHERDLARGEVDLLRSQLDEAEAEMARATENQERTRADLGGAVSRAAAGARQLGQSLADVARLLSPGTGESDEDIGEATGPPVTLAYDAAAGSRVGSRPLRSGRPALPKRRPVSLPPAMFDDSFEAGEYLVRVSGVLLIVDGYNVTISSWPHLQLPQQRQRLVDALAELAMRTGISVDVVFDGLDMGGRIRPPNAARHQVSVTFSPEGVEADEVIVDLVEQLDYSQPVLVATDDRRVREEVSERGANVISVVQLLAVLGRLPGGSADRGRAAR